MSIPGLILVFHLWVLTHEYPLFTYFQSDLLIFLFYYFILLYSFLGTFPTTTTILYLSFYTNSIYKRWPQGFYPPPPSFLCFTPQGKFYGKSESKNQLSKYFVYERTRGPWNDLRPFYQTCSILDPCRMSGPLIGVTHNHTVASSGSYHKRYSFQVLLMENDSNGLIKTKILT